MRKWKRLQRGSRPTAEDKWELSEFRHSDVHVFIEFEEYRWYRNRRYPRYRVLFVGIQRRVLANKSGVQKLFSLSAAKRKAVIYADCDWWLEENGIIDNDNLSSQ